MFQWAGDLASGINSRANPFTRQGGGGRDWPRNGALLRGFVYEKAGKQYLKAVEIQQAGKKGFKPVLREESWMPFDADGNKGRWLHPPRPHVKIVYAS